MPTTGYTHQQDGPLTGSRLAVDYACGGVYRKPKAVLSSNVGGVGDAAVVLFQHWESEPVPTPHHVRGRLSLENAFLEPRFD